MLCDVCTNVIISAGHIDAAGEFDSKQFIISTIQGAAERSCGNLGTLIHNNNIKLHYGFNII